MIITAYKYVLCAQTPSAFADGVRLSKNLVYHKQNLFKPKM